MLEYIEYVCVAAIGIVLYQFYAYSVSLKGVEKQNSCQSLGIIYVTLGILSFIIRTTPLVIGGIVLTMMGLRLIAHGLDRIDKSVFIDRYDSEE